MACLLDSAPNGVLPVGGQLLSNRDLQEVLDLWSEREV